MIEATVLKSALLQDVKGVRHAFFTRQGGISEGIYAHLNCGYGSRDDVSAVKENRRRAAEYLRCGHEDIVTPYQIHSAEAIVVDAPFAAESRPKADAVVTRVPGQAIGVLTADCTPVLLADPEAKVVGAAHAGWRGAVSGVLEEVISKMETIGASRSRIRASIGPVIYQKNYEVGFEFETEFLSADLGNQRFFKRLGPDSKPYFCLLYTSPSPRDA